MNVDNTILIMEGKFYISKCWVEFLEQLNKQETELNQI